MRISARAEYALRAVIEIASREPSGPLVKADEIAEAQDVPGKFLEQILSDLRRSGLVRSRRGATGGYALTRSPDEISLADVIRAVDGPLAWVRDQRPGTVEYPGNAAPLREVWIAVRAALRSVLDEVTISQILHDDLPRVVTDLTQAPGVWDD